MNHIDNALVCLSDLFRIWGWEDYEECCRQLLEDGNAKKVRRWLYETLKQFEECSDMGWGAHQSGVILFNSGLIDQQDVDLGAAALLKIFEEAP